MRGVVMLLIVSWGTAVAVRTADLRADEPLALEAVDAEDARDERAMQLQQLVDQISAQVAASLSGDVPEANSPAVDDAPQIPKWLAALDDLDSPAAEQALAEFLKYRRRSGAQFDNGLIAKFRRGLSSSSPHVRRHSIVLLQEPHGPWVRVEDLDAFSKQIGDMLVDDDLEVRREATRYFQQIDRESLPSYPRVLPLLWANARRLDYRDHDHADLTYAELTVSTLGRVLITERNGGMFNSARSAIDDVWMSYACFVDAPLPEVRIAAFDVLYDACFIPTELFAAVRRGVRDADVGVRAAALGYVSLWLMQNRPKLARSDRDELAACLAKAFKSKDRRFSRQALYDCASAMEEDARIVTPFLLEDMRGTDVNQGLEAARTLAQVDDGPQTMRHVLSCAARDGNDFRLAASCYLSSLDRERRPGSREWVDDLVLLLSDARPEVRLSAVRIILESQLSELHDDALAEAESLLHEPDFGEVSAAEILEYVSEFGLEQEAGRRAMRRLIYHSVPAVRRQVMQDLYHVTDCSQAAYRRYGDDVAAVAQRDSYPEVREAAEQLLTNWRADLAEQLRELPLP